MALWDPSLLKRFLVISTLIVLTGYIHYFPAYYLLLFTIFFLLFICQSSLEKRWAWLPKKMPLLFSALLSPLIIYQSLFNWGMTGTITGLVFVLLSLSLLKLAEKSLPFAQYSSAWIIVALLFTVVFDAGILLYRGGTDMYYHGYIRGERDPWADLQIFAREHSQKDDLFIVPPDMNDFGLYSDRATLGDWAEGANILYMDNTFARAWLERMNDLGWHTLWEKEVAITDFQRKHQLQLHTNMVSVISSPKNQNTSTFPLSMKTTNLSSTRLPKQRVTATNVHHNRLTTRVELTMDKKILIFKYELHQWNTIPSKKPFM